MRFKPGCSWWIATLGASAKTQYPDEVHFCEQIGVTEDEFKYALGRKWLTSTEFSFSALKSRKVGYARFVTADLINPYSDYGSETESPAADSGLIVSGAASSAARSSWAILPVSRLLRSIEKLAPPIPVQEPDKRTTAQHDSVTKIALLSIDCDNSGRISTRCYFQFVQKDFWGSAHRYDARLSFRVGHT
jgi:hypothetical protein